MFTYLIKCLYILLFLNYFNQNIFINSYNNEAHEAIAMTAMSGLQNNQLYEIKKLLRGKDLVDIGKWAHLVHNKIKEAEKMHYNLQKDGNCKEIILTCENEDGLCLLNSIKHFYNQLLGEKIPNDNFKYPKKLLFTDSDNLKYLVSLLADMHQPLRLGFVKDNGGKNVNAIYKDINNKKIKVTLFDYFENDIIDKMVLKYENLWYGGWTHINRIFTEHKKDEALFEKHGINVINIWAKEIIEDFCSEFYLSSFLSNNIINEKEIYLDVSKDIDINYDLEHHLERVVRNNILKAGSRIAILLNYIFSNKTFTSFRKTSEFDKVQIKTLENAYSNDNKKNALLINISLIIIIIIIIFYVNFFLKKRNTKNLLNHVIEEELQEKNN